MGFVPKRVSLFSWEIYVMAAQFTWKRIVTKQIAAPQVSYELWLAGKMVGYCAGFVGGGWKAYAKLGEARLWWQAASPASARSALEREIDKRSIGLLGVDDVQFAHA